MSHAPNYALNLFEHVIGLARAQQVQGSSPAQIAVAGL
jgi:hypothetical protein